MGCVESHEKFYTRRFSRHVHSAAHVHIVFHIIESWGQVCGDPMRAWTRFIGAHRRVLRMTGSVAETEPFRVRVKISFLIVGASRTAVEELIVCSHSPDSKRIIAGLLQVVYVAMCCSAIQR